MRLGRGCASGRKWTSPRVVVVGGGGGLGLYIAAVSRGSCCLLLCINLPIRGWVGGLLAGVAGLGFQLHCSRSAGSDGE